MELTLLKLPSTSAKGLNWVSWSHACIPPQNQRRQPCVLVSQLLKLRRFLQLPGSPSRAASLEKSSLATYCLHLSDWWTEGGEKESDTDFHSVLGSSSYTNPAFTASKKPSTSLCTLQSTHKAQGQLEALVSPLFLYQPES